MLKKGLISIAILFLLVFSTLTTAYATAPYGAEWCCYYDTCNFFTCRAMPWLYFVLGVLLLFILGVVIAVWRIKKRNKV